jgi:hypothetical protein
MSDCRIAVSSAQGFGGDEMTADPDDGDAGHPTETYMRPDPCLTR